MRLLLDTHVLIWFGTGDTRLPPSARRAITDAPSGVFVSAASAWEIATKARIGKLPPGPLATAFIETVRAEGFRILSVGAQDAQDAGNLPGPHGDPFDRMLVAQALRRDLAVISNDAVLDQFGVTRLWA